MTRITTARPGVFLRDLACDVVEVDLDARRSTQGFHAALSRMRWTLAGIHVRVFNEAPDWWEPQDGHSDAVCPDAGAARCMHRVIIAATDAPQAAALLHTAGYAVAAMTLVEPPTQPPPSPPDHEDAPTPPVGDVPDYPPVARPEVDPHERCEVCGFRAYVLTAHTADGKTLAWCGHHFAELAEREHPFVVADSRHLLNTTP